MADHGKMKIGGLVGNSSLSKVHTGPKFSMGFDLITDFQMAALMKL
jgi:hypothetical protein